MNLTGDPLDRPRPRKTSHRPVAALAAQRSNPFAQAGATVSESLYTFEEFEPELEILTQQLRKHQISLVKQTASQVFDGVTKKMARKNLVAKGIPDILRILYYAFSNQLVWPLFVLSGRGGRDIGASLPFGIELIREGGDIVLANERSPIVTTMWAQSLTASWQRAKEMWRSEYRHEGTHPTEVVDSMGVLVDTKLADEVLSLTGFQAEVEGASADALFTARFLGALLGLDHDPAATCTATVGSSKTTAGQAKLGWPTGIREKLNFVVKAQHINKVVLPTLMHEQSINDVIISGVNFAFTYSLADACNVLYPDGWRKNCFCQTAEASLRARAADLSIDDISDALAKLRALGEPVLLESRRRAFDLRAQQYGQTTLPLIVCRLNLDYFSKLVIYQRDTPPNCKIFIYRILPSDDLFSFWEIFLFQIFLSWSRVKQLLEMPAQSALIHLAEALNFGSRTSDAAPRRFDVVCIYGMANLIGSQECADTSTVFRAPLSQIPLQHALLVLKSLLRPNLDDRMRRFLGNVRLIASDFDSPPVEPNAAILRRLPRDVRQALSRLIFYRSEFSIENAAMSLRSLGLNFVNVRELLGVLVSRGVIYKYRGLFAHKWDWQRACERLTSEEAATLASETATAMLPYLAASEKPMSFNFAELRPQRLKEARWLIHIAIAALSTQTTSARDFGEPENVGVVPPSRRTLAALTDISRLRNIDATLQQFFRTNGLSYKNYLFGPLPNVKTLSNRMGRRVKNGTLPVTEVDHEVLEALALFVRRISGSPEESNIRSATVALTKKLIESSVPISGLINSAGDKGSLSGLHLHSLLALMLIAYAEMRFEVGLVNPRELDGINSLIWGSLDDSYYSSLMLGNWFECLGDSKISDAEAFHIYLRGARASGGLLSLWIKLMGCVGDTRQEAIVRQAVGELPLQARSKLGLWEGDGEKLSNSGRQNAAAQSRWKKGLLARETFVMDLAHP